jgi:hypothetical protein
MIEWRRYSQHGAFKANVLLTQLSLGACAASPICRYVYRAGEMSGSLFCVYRREKLNMLVKSWLVLCKELFTALFSVVPLL